MHIIALRRIMLVAVSLAVFQWTIDAAEPGVAGSSTVIPAGTRVVVRVNENISGISQDAGYTFPVVLEEGVRVDGAGTVVVPSGAAAHARIVKARQQSHPTGQVLYTIELTDLAVGGKARPVTTEPIYVNVDTATGSPYPGPATGVIVANNALLVFTIKAPVAY